MNGYTNMGVCSPDYAETIGNAYVAFMSATSPEPSSATLMMSALALIWLILVRARPHYCVS